MAKGIKHKYGADKTLRDMAAFHRSVDWREWWEEFYLERNPNGTYKYRTLREFAANKSKSEEQKRFILWYCGPDIYDDEDTRSKYPFVVARQGDWRNKRQQGEWYREEQHRLSESIKAYTGSAFQSVRQAGLELLYPQLVVLASLPAQVWDLLGGQLVPDAITDINDRVKVARNTMGLLGDAHRLQADAFNLFAKTQGMSFENFEANIQLIAASINATEAQHTNRVKDIIDAMTMDVLDKSHKFNLPIPDSMKKAAIDVTQKSAANKIKPN